MRVARSWLARYGAATVSTGAMTGVTLLNNGGSHQVTFSGGLDIDPPSGTAFNASSAGRVAVRHCGRDGRRPAVPMRSAH